jgi:D-glycero-D-manno-heptose 1,7-bisphosphate phosphatase
MSNKAVFLDRDGVINKDPGYVHKIEDFELYSDAIKALKLLKDFKLIIVSNQSGIGRGYYKEEDFHKFNTHLTEELKKQGIKIEKTYFCPHHPDIKCDCRKPNIKFIKQAEKEFNLDLKNSFMIGDHPHDIEFGQKAGLRSIYLTTGHGIKHKEDLKKRNVTPDLTTDTLLEAARWILAQK